eukprot:TRINITY_DN1820_c0_g2_i2.p1 TRINITY_DN1820_c0_g2~~TRINITY_DN1820_c0_g2_i2.p1  ORF type:complete len:443 (+),score=54.87 TRINITY_DN1820_c0_g2_i2:98-1426(+)
MIVVLLVFLLESLFFFTQSKCPNATAFTFGHELLGEFMYDPQLVQINHGSFGSLPKQVLAYQRWLQEQQEGNPDLWFRVQLEPMLLDTLKMVAKYINADSEDIVFVENASQGISAIIRSLEWTSGDKALAFDIAYDSVREALNFIHDRYGVELIKVNLTEEVLQSDKLIVQRVQEAVNQNPGIKLAVIDHISSTPSLILPLEDITQVLKSKNITVFVDGAHAIGQIPLDFSKMGCDFYVSNFHKWMFNPKGASFLYVRKEWQSVIHPLVINHHYRQGFQLEFLWEGTKDMTAMIAVREAMQFRERFGDHEIMEYNRDLAWRAGNLFARVWGTEMLVKEKERCGAIVNVRTPTDDWNVLSKVQDALFQDYKAFLVIFNFSTGHYYARLCAQIFLEISDFERIATTFMTLLETVQQKAVRVENLQSISLSTTFTSITVDVVLIH